MSRHVLFDDDSFPFKELTSVKENVHDTGNSHIPDLIVTFPNSNTSPLPTPQTLASPIVNHKLSTRLHVSSTTNSLAAPIIQPDPFPNFSVPLSPSNEQELVPLINVNQSQSIPSTIVDALNHPSPPVHSMTTRSKAGAKKPNPKYVLLVITNKKVFEPTCFGQTIKQGMEDCDGPGIQCLAAVWHLESCPLS